MSWIPIMVFSLLVFFFFIFLLRKFVGYMKREQSLEIESLKSTLIDPDNPIGLSGTELDKLKKQQQEAQAHLREVISKIPVKEKDGRFQIDEEEVRRRRESQNGTGDEARKPDVSGQA
ncbi:hypothetical protein [Chlorobium sp. N1]|uniref:hypothetical protein n=1 Tax=Chlorobium sp. N1 TaxID=2491138 RepID=UPI001039DCD6|nr:hypothetical protein [Chlorobium sp. N1]TCD48876.1 hypothetical protein E0L29_03045 [Chlorobium sp. N1]